MVAYCLGKLKRVFLFDASMTHQMMVTKKNLFEKPEAEYKSLENGFGPNIVSASDSGPYWKKFRKIAEPAFAKDQLSKLAEVSVDHGSIMMDYISDNTNNFKNSIDVVNVLNQVTIAILAKVAFGVQIEFWKKNVQLPKGHNMSLLESANISAGGGVIYRLIFPKLIQSFLKRLPFPNFGKHYSNALDEMNGYLLELLNEKKKNCQSMKEGQQIDNLMNYLMHAQDANGNKLTDDEIIANEFIFMFAGYETSSKSLAWVLYELAKRPDLQDLIKKEGDAIEGRPSLEHYIEGKLTFVKNCIKEGLRLHPPVLFVPKKAIKNLKLVDDNNVEHKIRKGHLVVAHVEALHHSETYW
eukprot:CAMPEP_0117427072 /NCGR_PEP_ID=MMETSP0758-20121206/7017_1 /TAXON_ID=63605 /ORGANISM="Percolomonas cosmopolitus, Strain AE-1 (ATCC 50343)" /LENGTH=353 /DNA_ID=CAMNT_0005212537 /DNA_START=158 /DNA_END=1216 /DNA_ORIENTATION=+